jgi:hypothetical protein
MKETLKWIRIDADLHRRIARRAKKQGMTIRGLVEEIFHDFLILQEHGTTKSKSTRPRAR